MLRKRPCEPGQRVQFVASRLPRLVPEITERGQLIPVFQQTLDMVAGAQEELPHAGMPGSGQTALIGQGRQEVFRLAQGGQQAAGRFGGLHGGREVVRQIGGGGRGRRAVHAVEERLPETALQAQPEAAVLVFMPAQADKIGKAAGVPRGQPDARLLPQGGLLDVGTGSGCIAWSVAMGRPGVEITAVDISTAALGLAESQFGDLPPGVIPPKFMRSDVLAGCPEIGGSFDMVLCNPPYVMEKEKSVMRANVLEYEPGLALFVPDDDPLKFYRTVAGISSRVLAASGVGLVEINEALGPETAGLFRTAGYKKTEILRDIFSKDRFVKFASSL